jgi:hypothetical protein
MAIFSVAPPRRNHVPWGRLSPWKWVPGISPGVKAAGAYGWRPTTLVVLNIKKIRGINPLNAELNPICHLLTLLGGATIVVVSRLRVNLPGTPWATSACCGRPLPLPFYKTLYVSVIFSAHHQEFSTVHSALVSFMQVLMTVFKQSSILTLLGNRHRNLYETYQCRMYSRELLMMGREVSRIM